MFILNSHKRNVSFCVLRSIQRLSVESPTERNVKPVTEESQPKILYNSLMKYIDIKPKKFDREYAASKKEQWRKEKTKIDQQRIQPIPLSLRYLIDIQENEKKNVPVNNENQDSIIDSGTITQFPYSHSYTIEEQESYAIEEQDNNKALENNAESIEEEIRIRHESMRDVKNWMTAYDNFEHDLTEEEEDSHDVIEDWTVNYGTPNPRSPISKVPCGGCGALLHCKDTAIPGYIPSEIFHNCNEKGAATLQAIICQRCFFLKEYNLALQVQVSPKDYPKVLTVIGSKRRALVVLMVDLMDFPCCIWPGVADILDSTPIFVVGNKVDLLPKDSDTFLKNIKHRLVDELKLNGFGSSKIFGVALVSAKTGYGVEELISSLYSKWQNKGDVYIVGCTNVGKSTLFNALIQSDYCKTQASDFIQRATTSLWPGTTLNLLKFPIMRISPYRMALRRERMKALQKLNAQEKQFREQQLRNTNDIQYATLIGRIDRSFVSKKATESSDDLFSNRPRSNMTGKEQMGINENSSDYVRSKWCYDTPGVVQPDQILNILTTEELVYVIPKQLIIPETFIVMPGTTLFIAGLARLDYLSGLGTVRLTVFRSNDLPITICPLEKADEVYRQYLGTKFFKVPIDKGDRLSKWPSMKSSKILCITGLDNEISSKDIVLSSAGWVAVNCRYRVEHQFKAWTPEARGIYERDCILPRAVTLRGPRIRNTVAYKSHKLI